jgi:hypothetical protein
MLSHLHSIFWSLVLFPCRCPPTAIRVRAGLGPLHHWQRLRSPSCSASGRRTASGRRPDGVGTAAVPAGRRPHDPWLSMIAVEEARLGRALPARPGAGRDGHKAEILASASNKPLARQVNQEGYPGVVMAPGRRLGLAGHYGVQFCIAARPRGRPLGPGQVTGLLRRHLARSACFAPVGLRQLTCKFRSTGKRCTCGR